MTLKESYGNLRRKRGFFLFLQRTLTFFLIVFGIYFLIFVWVRHLELFDAVRIDQRYYIHWLTGLRKTDFLNAGVFGVIAFLIWNRLSLEKLKVTRRSGRQTFVYGALSLLCLVGHYAFKYIIALSPPQTVWPVIATKYSLIVLFIAFAAIAIYTAEFLKSFVKKYSRSLLTATGAGVVYFFLIQLFQHVWYSLSYMVGFSVKWLLSLGIDSVIFSPGTHVNGPRLGAAGFNVGISNECSGIDSLLLFLSLYTLLILLDWKRMHLKRMLILLVPGLVGTIAYNIIRIYLLMLVGIYIDPEFAVDVFHTNVGWILFLVFFVVFWYFGSKWVYRKT